MRSDRDANRQYTNKWNEELYVIFRRDMTEEEKKRVPKEG
jgi:hypothetical protein